MFSTDWHFFLLKRKQKLLDAEIVAIKMGPLEVGSSKTNLCSELPWLIRYQMPFRLLLLLVLLQLLYLNHWLGKPPEEEGILFIYSRTCLRTETILNLSLCAINSMWFDMNCACARGRVFPLGGKDKSRGDCLTLHRYRVLVHAQSWIDSVSWTKP